MPQTARHPYRHRRRFASVAAAALLATSAWSAAPAAASEVPASGSREEVVSAYRSWRGVSESWPAWSGSTSTCTPGTPSPGTTQAALASLNYLRALAKVPPVGFDAGLSADAQTAALVSSANGTVSADPPDSWRCMSAQARSALDRSLLTFGRGGIRAPELLVHGGPADPAVAGRSWLLDPTIRQIGFGSTTDAAALLVVGAPTAPDPAPGRLVAWPSAGFFPGELEPGGRWSLSSSTVDFSTADVTVTGSQGPVPVLRKGVGTGAGQVSTLWWVISAPRQWESADERFRVTVSNLRNAPTPTVSYEVVLVRATAAPPPLPPPVVPVPFNPGAPQPPRLPLGNLDAVVVQGRKVTLRGWVWDPDLPGGGLAAAAGTWATLTLAAPSERRPELVPFGISPVSGINAAVTLPPGTHTVCLWGLDHDGARYTGASQVVGCQQVVVK